MRKETAAERDAWTEFLQGKPTKKKRNKYGNVKVEGYDSKREAAVGSNLAILAKGGKIKDLQEQVRIVLVEGKGEVKPITYIADFTYSDLDGTKHVLDAKGVRTDVYKLKKKLAFLLHGIVIEEV